MKIINRNTKNILRSTLIILLTYCMLFNSSVVLALTSADLAGADGLTSSTWGDATVLATDNGAILNWNNFNTNSSQSVQFIQPGADAAVLNRVISGEMTQFNGALLANGRVFIVNPAGVYFGSTATVNVNQLVAASLSMSDEDFEGMLEDVGNLMIFNGYGGQNVTNDGTINANSVYLIGKNVINNGNINCPDGTVLMAAGDGVYLTQDGSSVFIEVNTQSNITNDGIVDADDGTIILAAGDMYSSAIANTGALTAAGGTIAAKAEKITNSGTIDVSSADGDAGSVSLKANYELVIAGTSIMKANGGISNDGADGGTITAKSDDSIVVEAGAEFEARGGSYIDSSAVSTEATFNGGEVEVSGESVYVYGGSVDASTTAAATDTINPEAGRWVVDFPELTIAAGVLPTGNPEAVENTIYQQWIESQSLAGTNLDLVAHSAEEETIITVEPMGELTLSTGDLALHTKYNTGGIEFTEDSGGDRTSINSVGGADVYMLAGAGGIITDDIISSLPSSDKTNEPGKIRLFTNNGGSITTGALSVTGGSYDEVSIIADGDLTINGDVETLTNQIDNDTKEVGQARTCLVSENGDVVINGSVTVDAHGKTYTTADVHIDAGENITINLDGGQVYAYAKTSMSGPANATINIHAGKSIDGPGTIAINGGGSNAVYTYAKAGGGSNSATLSTDGASDFSQTATKGDAFSSIDINKDRTADCPDCPTPPNINPPIVPNAPLGLDDLGITDKYQYVYIDVLSNDTGDSELNILLTSKTTAEGGTVKLNPYGQVTYTPPADLSGLEFNSAGQATDTFTYTVKDEGGLVSELVTVTVILTNNLPLANADTAQTLKYTGLPINLLANDTDADELDQLNVLLSSGTTALGGTVTVNSDGTVTYTPPEDLSGVTFDGSGLATDSFTYVATDSYNDSAAQQVVITLVNNIPVAADDSAQTFKYDALPIDVLSNDTDADVPDQLNVLLSSGTTALGGTVTVNPDGTVNYTPPADLSGISFDENGYATDTFTYIASDSYNDSASQQVNVTLVNNLPVAANDTAEVSKNSSSAVIDVLGNDTDADVLDLLEILSTSANSTLGGTVTVNPDGTVTYTLPETLTFDENGKAIDTFTYTATDHYNNTESKTVTVTIVNNLPVTVTDTSSTVQNQPVEGNVLNNDIDLDDDSLEVIIDGNPPQHGTVVLNEDGTYTYTPDIGYTGEDSFSYIASDGFNSTYGTVIIRVGYIAVAPLPANIDVELSGCPALMQWVAQEVGVEEGQTQIWIANTLANARDIQPCQACANLKQAAEVLVDTDGAYLTSLAQIVNEFASTDEPPSEEQMALITDAIANNAEAGNAYAQAGEYLDALVAYVGILNSNLNLTSEQSITVATEKYILPMAENGNTAVAVYLSSRITTPQG